MKTSVILQSKSGARIRLMLPLLLCLFTGFQALAHCDSYDGPVIKDAYKALKTENVNLVLKWIEPEHEEEISALFSKTLKYRQQDEEVYELLERHFLETLVRVHREGEGAPYTGLKPAGSISPIIEMTDAAIESENLHPLLETLESHIGNLIREKYNRLLELRDHKEESTAQGRDYVSAYVDYTHTVEALHTVLEHAGGAEHSGGKAHEHL